jgi:hypothetical protein
VLPAAAAQWTVRRGVEELYGSFLREGLTVDDFTSSRFLRIKHVKELQAGGLLDETLRFAPAELADVVGAAG